MFENDVTRLLIWEKLSYGLNLYSILTLSFDHKLYYTLALSGIDQSSLHSINVCYSRHQIRNVSHGNPDNLEV